MIDHVPETHILRVLLTKFQKKVCHLKTPGTGGHIHTNGDLIEKSGKIA